jgi:hypothetical protein
MKQWPQGLWVVTPEGKTIGFHYHKPNPGESYGDGQKRWVADTLSMLNEAAKVAGPLTAREVKAKPEILVGRGRGVGDDGEVRPAISVVAYLNGKRDGAPVVDSIHLSEDQAAEFAPPKDSKAGTDWSIPEATARRFTPALSPMTDPIFSPTPDDATTAKITAKVERIANGVTVVRYAGNWETAHNRDKNPKFPIQSTATGDGIGVFDSATGKLKEMIWVLNGTYRIGTTEKPRTTGAVIEWTAVTP